MSLLDPRDKTISLKVVYYGPGLGGKTTSLKHIHHVIDPEGKVKLVSLDTDEDRTLFFDFLPIELGLVGRFKIKIQGFTVPGQVKYNMTRRYVLTGADGVVFVADSDPSRLVENVESLINLGDNLRAHGLNVNNIPLVFQFNKQDLPNALDPKELEEKLNFRKVPSFATIATGGDSVYDAFKAVAKLMVSRVIKTYNLKQEQADEERILQEVEARLVTLATDGMEAPTEIDMPPIPVSNRDTELVAAAVQAPVRAMAVEAAPPSAGPAPVAASAINASAINHQAEEFFDSFCDGEPKTVSGAPMDRASAPPARERPQPVVSSADDRVAPVAPVALATRPVSAMRPEQPAVSAAPEQDEPDSAAAVAAPLDHGADLDADLDAEPHRDRARPAGTKKARRAIERPSQDVDREDRSSDNHRRDGSSSSTRNFMRSLLEIGRVIAGNAPPEKTATVILSTACQAFDAMGASVLVKDKQGALLPAHTNGFRRDPLSLALGSTEILELIENSGDQIMISENRNPDVYDSVTMINAAVESVVLIPLIVKNEVDGAFVIYFDELVTLARRKDDMRMMMVLACQMAIARSKTA